MSKTDPRFPFEAARRITWLELNNELAERFGVQESTIARWKRDGLDAWTADKVAVQLKFHPNEVWPGWGATLDEALRLRREQQRAYDVERNRKNAAIRAANPKPRGRPRKVKA